MRQMAKPLLARKEVVIEDFHGTQVADPYRWLEDPASPETKAWTESQNEITREALAAIPARDRLQQRLTELWNYPKYFVPQRANEGYLMLQNDGLQNQPALYLLETLTSQPRLVLDPNELSPDGTLALTNFAPSRDGKRLAYALSQSGSDWQVLRIRNLDRDEDLPEVLVRCKFTNMAWRPDGTGFYYSRFPDEGEVAPEDESNFSRVYYHRVGTPQAEDELVFEQPEDKELSFFPEITEDGSYLVLHVSHGTDAQNGVYYRELDSAQAFTRVLHEGEAMYNVIGNDGTVFYLHTDQSAPKGRIIAMDVGNPEPQNWVELVPEQSDAISSVKLVSDQFVVVTMHDAYHRLHVYNLDGSFTRELPLPTPGSIIDVSGRRKDRQLFFSFTSYLYPTSIFRFDFTLGELQPFRVVELAFPLANFETKQVFYASKDGTRVPMFLTHKKGLELDGQNPVLIYGYGGFNISLTPQFSIAQLTWLEQGGVYAVANLRGGNEYGEDWHRAGMLHNKQNVFDDFISAAEWLIAEGYTNSRKLASMGGSNGGLLVSACMLQRPALYGAVVCMVPVTDMLRFHRFTVGRYWTGEYGNAQTSAEDFKTVYAYSPLHNVKQGVVYPPTLITTADTDDRVVPLHAKKFTATLQAASGGDNPILLRVESKAVHGHGKPISKVIEEQADIYAFLFDVLGIG